METGDWSPASALLLLRHAGHGCNGRGEREHVPGDNIYTIYTIYCSTESSVPLTQHSPLDVC